MIAALSASKFMYKPRVSPVMESSKGDLAVSKDNLKIVEFGLL